MINNITLLYPVISFQASISLTNQEYLLDFAIFPSINILIGYYSLGLPLTWWPFRLLFWFLLISFISKSQSTLRLNPQISSLYTLSLCDLIQYYGFKYQIYIISWFSSLLTQPELARVCAYNPKHAPPTHLSMTLPYFQLLKPKSWDQPWLFFLSAHIQSFTKFCLFNLRVSDHFWPSHHHVSLGLLQHPCSAGGFQLLAGSLWIWQEWKTTTKHWEKGSYLVLFSQQLVEQSITLAASTCSKSVIHSHRALGRGPYIAAQTISAHCQLVCKHAPAQ